MIHHVILLSILPSFGSMLTCLLTPHRFVYTIIGFSAGTYRPFIYFFSLLHIPALYFFLLSLLLGN